MHRSLLSMFVGSLLLVGPANAEFSGKVSFGYLGTSGNAESTSVNAGSSLNWAYTKWEHTLDLQALGAQDDVDTTAEAYIAQWKSDFALNERSYLFGLARYEKDKFSGYDQQLTQAVGYGRNLIDTESTTWDMELGAGARQSDLRDETTESETIVRFGTDYAYRFTETNEFTANFSVESGEANTLAQTTLAIKARLVGDLALVASYRVRYNSDVPVGNEETDTFTAISLEYAF
ncbi:MAG: DUF481 domain-containing protein [Pseudomonadota bacterium]